MRSIDKRRDARLVLNNTSCLFYLGENNEEHNCILKNISENGVCLEFKNNNLIQRIKVGDKFTIQFVDEEVFNPENGIYTTTGEIIRIKDNEIGCILLDNKKAIIEYIRDKEISLFLNILHK